jgi:hypothetical protein
MITYTGTATFLVAKFGASFAGLSTVGYTLKNPDGSTHQARTTTGVLALGGGDYAVSYTSPNTFAGYIEWDTGGATPVYAREELLVMGVPGLTVTSTVGLDGTTLTLVRGDDYKAADGRALQWTNAAGSWPNLTGATIQFTLQPHPLAAVTKTGVVDVATGAGQKVHVDLLAADTLTARPGEYPYDLQATLSNADKVTLAQGRANLLIDYTP